MWTSLGRSGVTPAKVILRKRRVYDDFSPEDGRRILVDRLWPRGLSKVRARVDYWAKAIAPSNELRQWYRHDAQKWPEFRARYFAELNAMPEQVEELKFRMDTGVVTLLYSSREQNLNNAQALLEYLEQSFSEISGERTGLG